MTLRHVLCALEIGLHALRHLFHALSHLFHALSHALSHLFHALLNLCDLGEREFFWRGSVVASMNLTVPTCDVSQLSRLTEAARPCGGNSSAWLKSETAELFINVGGNVNVGEVGEEQASGS